VSDSSPAAPGAEHSVANSSAEVAGSAVHCSDAEQVPEHSVANSSAEVAGSAVHCSDAEQVPEHSVANSSAEVAEGLEDSSLGLSGSQGVA